MIDDLKTWIVGLADGRLILCNANHGNIAMHGDQPIDGMSRGACVSILASGDYVVACFQSGEIVLAEIATAKVYHIDLEIKELST